MFTLITLNIKLKYFIFLTVIVIIFDVLIICKSACTKIKRSMLYQYDLNIYRGCEHSCKCCYRIYSHKYLESNYKTSTNSNIINSNNINPNNSNSDIVDRNTNDFFNNIYIKTNIAKELDKQFLNLLLKIKC